MAKYTKETFPDSRCYIIFDRVYLRHRTGNHPEHPQRLISARKALEDCDFAFLLDWESPQKAEVSELLRVHTEQYVETVRTACEKATDAYIRLDQDTVVCSESYEAALFAVGGVEKAVDLALGSGQSSAFALVRPPGHHALPGRSMGFCLFNNIAIAARYALDRHNLKRVMIVDWDLHHGNGTHDVFYDDDNVFFISLHQAHHYPGTGFADEIGEGKGEGYTLNIPLPPGSDDSDYAHCFVELVGPLIRTYKPELILVSAGFDAHMDDPLGLMRVTEGEFGRLSYFLRREAVEVGARLVFTLEGGYDLQALGESVVETVRPLVLSDPDDSFLPRPFTVSDDVITLVDAQIKRMAQFWDIKS